MKGRLSIYIIAAAIFLAAAVISCKKKIPISSISLNSYKAALIVGETLELTASIYPSDASNQTITWMSRNPDVADVTNDGMVTALASGTTLIGAFANDGSEERAICTLNVHTTTMQMTSSSPYITLRAEAASVVWGDGSVSLMQEVSNSNNATFIKNNHSGTDTIRILGDNITILTCFNNRLTSLYVSKNPVLQELYCSGNQLTSLDVNKNTELTSFICDFNQLTSLDVSNNIMLTYLSCQNNELSAAALDALFYTLPDNFIPGAMKSININGNPGTSSCTPSIAVKRGWLVITTTY